MGQAAGKNGAGFFQNRDCPYFPCHQLGEEAFNCLFCYCPLYALGPVCGGKFTILPSGVKDCSGCVFPHIRGNYPRIVEKTGELVRRMAKEQKEKET